MQATTADHIRIVLVETSHPGNIGAAARAMKTMGLHRLELVKPNRFPGAEATGRASGADNVLSNAGIHDRLEDAIADCGLIIGTSARVRSLGWPLMGPREAAVRIVDEAQRCEVAVVFGREHSGLKNEELDLCNAMLRIPTNPDFSSLNLGSAVQVLAWEVSVAMGAENEASTEQQVPVDARQMEMFYEHLEQTMIDLDFFDPEKPRRLKRRLYRLFNRAQLDESEVQILRGILGAAQAAVKKNK